MIENSPKNDYELLFGRKSAEKKTTVIDSDIEIEEDVLKDIIDEMSDDAD